MDRDDLWEEVDRLLARHSNFGDKDRIYVLAKLLEEGSFTWSYTPQKHDYWNHIHNELEELAETYSTSSSSRNKTTATTSGVGTAVSVANVLERVEQLLLDVKATVEAESAKPEQAKKLVKFMTYALHKLEGREAFGECGLVQQLKDADV